jgi:glutamate-5-semialdehyde dehydrogenase
MKIEKQLQNVLAASRKLNLVEAEKVNKVLFELANQARKNCEFILNENQKDLERMDSQDPKYDRLKLTEERIEGIASDIENVANLESPVGII